MKAPLLRFTFFLLMCLIFPLAATAQVVSIPDANLRTAIENALGKAAGAPITIDEMATLTRLEAKNVNISDLTGLEHARNLERLDLSGDWVSGKGLANSNEVSNVSPLSGLTQLTSLDLGGNNISDISPLAELTNLTSLYLYDNSLSDISAVANLTNLTRLGFWNNSVSDISAVANLTNLTLLFLGANSVSDISVVAGLTNLIRLGLGGNNISDISAVAGLTNLTSLSLGGNSLSDISAIAGLINLTSLYLERNNLSDISLLSGLTNLTSLSLAGNSLSDISPLAGLTQLTSLYLAGNSISDISPLAGLTQLTSLHLGRNNISDISPLVANTGLGNGDTVDVRSNPLNSVSLQTHIPALKNRGVTVQFDGTTHVDVGQPMVDIPDPNLRAAIENALGKAAGAPITAGEMATLTRLEAPDASIYNLTGLEHAINLTVLNLLNNNLSNISILSGLTNLTRLYLGGNSISDILPLVANTGLGNGDTVDVRGNPLNSASLQTHIPALKSRGVTVQFDGTTHGDVGQPIVDIPDANLRAAIENALGKAAGASITVGEMATLTQLVARNASISDLTGLEHARNLQWLDLDGEWVQVEGGFFNSNAVSNFSPILGLTNLTGLNLGGNSLSDISVLAGLTNLTELHIERNSLSDISVLAGLTNLTRLHIGNNNISDISALAGLTNLTRLHLERNNISDLSALAGLTNLTSLILTSNPLSDISALAGLTNLTQLNLGSNNISDISALGNLTNLTTLYLRYNNVSDISALAGLTNLTSLILTSNPLSDISALAGLTNLTWLNLERNSLSDISALGNLTNLTTLYLGYNNISDISTLGNLTNLTTLYLRYNNVSDISAVAGLTNLTWLNLRNNNVSDISPLVANTGLGKGDTVEVRANPLSYLSLPIHTHIPTLQSRGVTVEFYDWTHLNIGEPRAVRLIYFLPKDRSYRANVVAQMKEEILNIQTFYAEQMEAHGYGKRAFRIETDTEGAPIVHRVDGEHPQSHYHDNTSRTVPGEISQAFDFRTNVYLIVADHIPGIGLGGGRRVAGVGRAYGRNGGYALFFRVTFGTMAHELGHAFGLQHDFRDDVNIMSYGSRRNQLSPCHAKDLSVDPYFNPDIPTRPGKGPTIELISPHTYPADSQTVPVRFKISDPEGLYQVILYVPTREGHPAAGSNEVKMCRGLEGETDTVVEFDYDGVIPSNRLTRLSDTVAHRITIVAVDAVGNRAGHSVTLLEFSPHHIVSLSGHRHIINSVSFSPDGTILASGADDGTVRLWDMTTRERLATLAGDISGVNSVSFSPDGTILASGADDGTVRLWDVTTRERFATLAGHTGAVNSVSFSPDGTTLASGGDDGAIKLWDVMMQTNIATFEEHTDVVSSVSFSPDGGTLASGSYDTTVKLWDVATGVNIASLPHSRQVTSMSLSPDGGTLASGTWGMVKLWDVATKANIATFEHPTWIYAVSFSPDGGTLAAGGWRRTVKLWDVATGANIVSLPHTSGVGSVAFSPDGTTFASGAWNRKVELWNASGLMQLRLESLIEIDMPDPNLRAAIATSFGMPPTTPIVRGHLENLTQLNARSANISDLTGLEGAINLRTLNLSRAQFNPSINSNSVSDISPLAGLTNLRFLYLRENNISDISPLVTNTGLGQGAKVDIRGNPLSYLSIHTHIPTLQNRGVTVQFTYDTHPALLKILGDSQKGAAFASLSQPFVVEAQDANGSVLAGVSVTFAVTVGGGTLSVTSTTTDAHGRAQTTLTLGPNLGTNAVKVAATGIQSTVIFHAIADTFPTEYLWSIPAGVSLIHLPLKVTTVDGVEKTITSVADLYDALGGAATVNLLGTHDAKTRRWLSYTGTSDRGTAGDPLLTDDKGIIASMKAPVVVRLRGDPLGTNGSSVITLHPGINIVGLPLRDSRIARVSDLFALNGIRGNVIAVTVSANGEFHTVRRVGDAGNIPITGGQSFNLKARRATTVAISGDGWYNASGTAAAPPTPLTGIQVTDTTPVLALRGSIVGEKTNLNKVGLRVTVKNLSNGKSTTGITGEDEAVRYQATIVEVEMGRAARIGDILEISAQSSEPFIDIQRLRYTVTAEDVKQNWIQLPALVAYEIPAKTELLANYPNPFNPETWIPYRLAEDAFVTLTIYDLSGQAIRTLDVGHQIAAVYESRSKAIYWDGRNEVGEQVASGVYFYTLTAADFSATRKMVILK